MIKRLLLILLTIALLVAGWFIYAFYFRTASYEKMAGERLQNAIRKGSDSLYRLNYEHIIINPLTLSVAIDGVHLYPDSIILQRHLNRGDTPVLLLDLKLKNLSVNGLSAKSLVADKELLLSSVEVEEADVEVRKISNSKKKDNGYNPDSLASKKVNLYDLISSELKMLKIDSVRLIKTNFHYKSNIRKYKEFTVKNLAITLKNILLDSNSVHEKGRFFLAESCIATVDKYTMPLNELYNLESASLRIIIPEGRAELENVKLLPLHSESGFVRKVITDKKRVALHVSSMQLLELNASAFFEDELIRADKLTLTDMHIDVYHDKYSPKDTISKMGEYPHQLLMDLNVDLHINEIEVKNAQVAYRQLNPRSRQLGKLWFSNINATIKNVSNNPDSLKRKAMATMNASGWLLGKVKLSSLWNFYNLDPKGLFTIRGNLGALDAKALNEVLVPLGMVRIEEGKINSIAFNIRCDDYNGHGELSFMYENFKVAVLEMEENKIEKQKSKSIIANKLFPNEHNRKGDKIPDQVPARFRRDPHRNLFHMAWNTMLDGLKKTLQHGRPGAKLLKGLKKTEQP